MLFKTINSETFEHGLPKRMIGSVTRERTGGSMQISKIEYKFRLGPLFRYSWKWYVYFGHQENVATVGHPVTIFVWPFWKLWRKLTNTDEPLGPEQEPLENPLQKCSECGQMVDELILAVDTWMFRQWDSKYIPDNQKAMCWECARKFVPSQPIPRGVW